MRFFISDLHFYHFNVISYSDRPFLIENREDGAYVGNKKISENKSLDIRADSIAYMNDTLISNWNSVVGLSDTVYFVGDFAFKDIEKVKEVVAKLNGYKIIVLGNHDKSQKVMIDCGFNEAYDRLEIEVGGNKIILSHYPYLDPRLTDIALLRPNIIKNIKGNDYLIIPDGMTYEEELEFLINQKHFFANPQKDKENFHKLKSLISKHIGTREINTGEILGHGHTHSTRIRNYNMFNFSCEALNYVPMDENQLLLNINEYKDNLKKISDANFSEYEYYDKLKKVTNSDVKDLQVKYRQLKDAK